MMMQLFLAMLMVAVACECPETRSSPPTLDALRSLARYATLAYPRAVGRLPAPPTLTCLGFPSLRVLRAHVLGIRRPWVPSTTLALPQPPLTRMEDTTYLPSLPL